jgi:hypothetical protein
MRYFTDETPVHVCDDWDRTGVSPARYSLRQIPPTPQVVYALRVNLLEWSNVFVVVAAIAVTALAGFAVTGLVLIGLLADYFCETCPRRSGLVGTPQSDLGWLSRLHWVRRRSPSVFCSPCRACPVLDYSRFSSG